MANQFEGVVTLRIIEAKNLVAADKSGTSDPYVVATYDKQRQKTPVQYRTLSPEWPAEEATFKFYLRKKEGSIKLCVYDHDEYSKDDELGDIALSISDSLEEAPVDEWVDLKNTKKGSIHVEYSYRPLEDNETITIIYDEDENDPEFRRDRTQEQGIRYWPLKGSVFPPSDFKPAADAFKLPTQQLELEFIQSFRGHDARDNLYVVPSTGDIVYHAAAVGIVFDPKNRTQRFFNHHDDDIVSLGVHDFGNGKVVAATGQVGKKPKIYVWDIQTLEILAEFQGQHERSVPILEFSPSGDFLLSIGSDDHNTIIIYDWKNKKNVASAYAHSEKVFTARWDPHDATRFATSGNKHIRFWKFENNKLAYKDGNFGKQAVQTIVSIAYTEQKDQVVSGTYNGDIYFWNHASASLVNAIPEAHQGPVQAVLFSQQHGIVSGGKDAKIRFWNAQGESVRILDLAENSSQISAADLAVKTLAVSPSNGNLFLGTRGNEIFVVEVDEDAHDVVPLVNGHAEEFWGLATHPTLQIYATTGNDKTVRVWDIEGKRQITFRKIEANGQTIDYSPDGKTLAVGLQSGNILILNADTLEELHKIDEAASKEDKFQVDDVKYSPDGLFLASGSHKNVVSIYQVDKGYKKIGTCKGHSSFVSHIDWSHDSKVLQSDSGSYEHLYWDVEDIAQITRSTAVRNLKWDTWTCILGWPVLGIWPKGADGTDINAVGRSHSSEWVATADDNGSVKVFRYPVLQGTPFREYFGHSSHVTNVKFSANDKYIISAGGNDRSLFHWKCTVAASIEPEEEEVSQNKESRRRVQEIQVKTPSHSPAKPVVNKKAAPSPAHKAAPAPVQDLLSFDEPSNNNNNHEEEQPEEPEIQVEERHAAHVTRVAHVAAPSADPELIRSIVRSELEAFKSELLAALQQQTASTHPAPVTHEVSSTAPVTHAEPAKEPTTAKVPATKSADKPAAKATDKPAAKATTAPATKTADKPAAKATTVTPAKKTTAVPAAPAKKAATTPTKKA